MNVVWGFLITAAVTAVAVGAMLLVRRRAPAGSYFKDGDRASGVFGVIATGFSVLLGFVVFLAFTSYDNALSGAQTEAQTLAQQVETAQLFGAGVAATLTGQLVCYGRYVIADEWPRMRDGTIGETINPWGAAMFRTARAIDPQSNRDQAAYGQWLSQTTEREQARLQRVHPASGVIPAPLWIVLFVIGGVIFVYMLFFADSGEGAVTQAVLMGAVTIVITVVFLLLVSLDRPFHGGVGGLQPTSMKRTLVLVDEGLAAVHRTVTAPCDARGKALR